MRPRPNNAYLRLASLTMHRLSFHNDAGAAAPAGGAPAGEAPAPDAAAAAAAAVSAAAADAAAAAAAAATGAASPEGAKPEGGAAPAVAAVPAVPEKYDLKVPDGSTLDADFVTRTADTARALGLSNEAGQKLLDAQIAEIGKATSAAIDAAKAEQIKSMQPGGTVWTEQEAKWRGSALTDAEIGGSPEKLQASADLAVKVVNRFASDDAKKFFTDSGLGSHPELVRMFARIGRSMSEATLALPGTRATAATTEDERLAKRYPTMAAKS